MRSPAKQPFNVGDRVVCSYRVAPFLSDETLEVIELSSHGPKSKPHWRVRCAVRRADRLWAGWLDADTLTLVAAWPRTMGDIV